MASPSHVGFADTSYTFFTLPAELRLKIYNFLMNDAIDRIDRQSYEDSSVKFLRVGHP